MFTNIILIFGLIFLPQVPNYMQIYKEFFHLSQKPIEIYFMKKSKFNKIVKGDSAYLKALQDRTTNKNSTKENSTSFYFNIVFLGKVNNINKEKFIIQSEIINNFFFRNNKPKLVVIKIPLPPPNFLS